MTFKKRFGAAMRAFSDPELVVRPKQLTKLVNEKVSERLSDKALQGMLTEAVKASGIGGDLDARQTREANTWKTGAGRWPRVQKMTMEAITKGGLTGGDMLEVGGRMKPRDKDFPMFKYHSLDLDGAPGGVSNTMIGDLTNCPHIPDESFDFIFSFDVFEHIDRPWLAASETCRLLRPGGITVHSTLFSWRYHPCPIDYFRYTAEGLKSLFVGLEPLHSAFDYTERRRDVRGQGGNAMKPDAFGGWRENVRVNYAGQKPL